jgi:hypothetical protein
MPDLGSSPENNAAVPAEIRGALSKLLNSICFSRFGAVGKQRDNSGGTVK